MVYLCWAIASLREREVALFGYIGLSLWAATGAVPRFVQVSGQGPSVHQNQPQVQGQEEGAVPTERWYVRTWIEFLSRGRNRRERMGGPYQVTTRGIGATDGLGPPDIGPVAETAD